MLDEPFSVVINEETARRTLEMKDPLGKALTFLDCDFKVTGLRHLSQDWVFFSKQYNRRKWCMWIIAQESVGKGERYERTDKCGSLHQ